MTAEQRARELISRAMNGELTFVTRELAALLAERDALAQELERARGAQAEAEALVMAHDGRIERMARSARSVRSTARQIVEFARSSR